MKMFLVLLIVLAASIAWSQDYPGVVLTTGTGGDWTVGCADSISVTAMAISNWGWAEKSEKQYISGFQEVCDTFWTLHKGEFQALYDRLFVQEGKLLFLKNNTYGKGFYVEVKVIDSIECHTDTLKSNYITIEMPKPQFDLLMMMLWRWYDNNSDLVWGTENQKWIKDISEQWEKNRIEILRSKNED
jgi:hypothetical protein